MKFAVVLLIAGCGTSPDDRPATLEVVTLEVLAPTCGQAQCHSTSTHLEGLALDTVDNTRASAPRLFMDEHGQPLLFEVLTTDDAEKRMPADSPMADDDIALIRRWYDAGTPGL